MNDQQQAAMQMALGAMLTAQNTLIFKCGGDMRPMERETLDDLVEAITSVQMALAQPQESDIEHHRAIKKRNAEVVALETAQPQGEPVGYLVYSLDGVSFEDRYCEGAEPVYTTLPSVEAAIEATKEKAAKVCDGLGATLLDDSEGGGAFTCAEAIRSMK